VKSIVFKLNICKIYIFTAKKLEEFYKFGNYRNYYSKRRNDGSTESDVRLDLLEKHSDLFKNKRVLDIGCNSGFITINLAKRLQTESILGLDIDGYLIDRARSDVLKLKTDLNTSDAERKILENVIFRKVRLALILGFN
jgi:SAM-dependent methyltransferase